MNLVAEIEVNNVKVQQIDCKKSKRLLGICMGPALVWDEQFCVMKEKMIEAMFKLKNANIIDLLPACVTTCV